MNLTPEANYANITKGEEVVSMWGSSIDSWTRVAYWTLWAGFIFGGLAVTASSISAYISYKTADLLQEENRKSMLDAARKIEEAKTEAARANERTAKLELEAARVRLEQEQFKAKLAWRRITIEQHDKIVVALRGQAMAVQLEFPPSDPEATMFANDISVTLRDAGMAVTATAVVSNRPSLGLGISRMPSEGQPPSAEWVLLASAFKDAGITFGLAEPATNLKRVLTS